MKNMKSKLLFKVMPMIMSLTTVMVLGNILLAQGHLNHVTEVNDKPILRDTQAEEENKDIAELKDIPPAVAKNLLSDLKGRVETEKMQTLSQGGLSYRLFW